MRRNGEQGKQSSVIAHLLFRRAPRGHPHQLGGAVGDLAGSADAEYAPTVMPAFNGSTDQFLCCNKYPNFQTLERPLIGAISESYKITEPLSGYHCTIRF